MVEDVPADFLRLPVLFPVSLRYSIAQATPGFMLCSLTAWMTVSSARHVSNLTRC